MNVMQTVILIWALVMAGVLAGFIIWLYGFSEPKEKTKDEQKTDSVD